MCGYVVKMADFCGIQSGQVVIEKKLNLFIKSFYKPSDFTKKSTKNHMCDRWQGDKNDNFYAPCAKPAEIRQGSDI